MMNNIVARRWKRRERETYCSTCIFDMIMFSHCVCSFVVDSFVPFFMLWLRLDALNICNNISSDLNIPFRSIFVQNIAILNSTGKTWAICDVSVSFSCQKEKKMLERDEFYLCLKKTPLLVSDCDVWFKDFTFSILALFAVTKDIFPEKEEGKADCYWKSALKWFSLPAKQ